MDWWETSIAAVCSLIAGVVGTYFLFRGKRVEQETEEAKAEVAAATAFVQGQAAFQEYVDGVVEKRVTAAVEAMQRQIADLGTAMSEMRRESHELHDAVRARETQLWLWNIRNRPGPMPELPDPILRRLSLSHLSSLGDLEDTQPTIPKE